MIRAPINRILARFGWHIERAKPPESLPVPLWDHDSRFREIMQQVAARTIVNRQRCYMIYQLARQASGLPGDAAEVGVYRGGTAKLLARVFEEKNKTLHLFDTFSGMPAADPEKDRHKRGDFGDASIEDVKLYLGDCRNVRFWQGFFPGTAKPLDDSTFCFVHVDADIHKSVIDSCIFFYPRMQKGGIMVFDDYGFPTCPGARKAVDDFFLDKPEKQCYLPTGQCFVMRLE